MSSSDLIFIDTNIYLDLFTPASSGLISKVLSPLVEIKEHIFITRQIVDEINRNKLKKVSELINSQLKYFSIPNFSFPDHCLDLNESEAKALKKELENLKAQINDLRNARVAKAKSSLENISKSEDKISKRLEVLFKKSHIETEDELTRAKVRWMRGNPPGKKNDLLGDQLSWEQLLAYCKGEKKKRIWIVTRDQDYYTEFYEEILLDPFLRKELKDHGIVEVFCFKELLPALSDFREKSGALQVKLPDEKQIQQISNQINQGIALQELYKIESSSIINAAKGLSSFPGSLGLNSAAYAAKHLDSINIYKGLLEPLRGRDSLAAAAGKMRSEPFASFVRELQSDNYFTKARDAMDSFGGITKNMNFPSSILPDNLINPDNFLASKVLLNKKKKDD